MVSAHQYFAFQYVTLVTQGSGNAEADMCTLSCAVDGGRPLRKFEFAVGYLEENLNLFHLQ